MSNQIAPRKRPDPAVVVTNLIAPTKKWQMGKTLRFIILACGTFWLIVAAGLFAYWH